MVYLCLDDHTSRRPPPLKHSPSEDAFTERRSTVSESVSSFRKILRVGADIFAVRLAMGFALLIYHSNFSLFLEKRFDSSPRTTGWVISFSSLASVLASLLVGKLSSLYSSLAGLLFHACVLQTATLAAMTLAPTVSLFLVGVACLSVSNSVLRVCVTDMSILRCRGEDTGALLGLSQSTMSVARMVSPLVAGVALEVSASGPGVVASAFGAVGAIMVPLFVMRIEDLPPEKKGN